jgi:hypothetical protein
LCPSSALRKQIEKLLSMLACLFVFVQKLHKRKFEAADCCVGSGQQTKCMVENGVPS